jgi:hypothetical protein
MKYAVETASYGMIYIPSFIKIRSGFRKFLGKINIQAHTPTHARARSHTHTHTHTHTEKVILSLLLFFQNKEIMRKY